MSMRRLLVALLLAGLVAGCVTAKNQPVKGPQDAVAGRQPGDSVVVGSISTPRDFDRGIMQARVVFAFRAYDPATDRLIPDGDSFLLERETCLLSSGAECNFSQPHHQVVTVRPGHYILAETEIYAANRAARFFYVPFEDDWWDDFVLPDAAVGEIASVRLEVKPGETHYFGQVVIAHTGKSSQDPNKARTLMEMAVEQNDTAALAALTAAGLPAEGLVYRPAVP